MFSLSNLFKKTATELPKVQTAKAYSLMLSKTELNKEKSL